jgi:MYXO-CTERM domain-containing protein
VKPYPTLLLIALMTAHSHGAATSATSSAEDISATATITGTLLGNNLADINLTVLPINSAEGTAPNPYSLTPSLLTVRSTGSGLAVLGLGVTADSLNVQSDVDGLEGSRSLSATSSITTASANLALDLGLLGTVDILSLGLDSGTGLITSQSEILFDGVTATGSASSNLITTGNALSLSVLGINISVPALTAGVSTPVGVNVTAGVLTVTGTILLTADDFDIIPNGNMTMATSKSLSLSADLSLSAGALAAIDVDSTININSTSAQLSAAPVPEPGPAAMGLMLLGASCLLRNRRR